MIKTPSRYVNNKNGVKLEHLRRYVPSDIQIVSFPTGTTIHIKKKKHFVTKFKKEYIKHKCIVKFLKLLHKLDKYHKLDKKQKFAKSNNTMEIIHAKSKLRVTIHHIKDVITLDPNRMKSNATANSSSPCPSFSEAMIP